MTGATVDGQIVGVPAFLFVDWLYYRTDWFDEAGLAPPDTWDEFREVAIALTDADEGRYGFGLRGGDGGQGQSIDIMRAYGGLSADEAGVPVIDREKAIEAIAFYSGLFTTDQVAPPSAPNDSYSQIMQAFRTGQTGMVFHHTGSLAEISADLTPEEQFMTPSCRKVRRCGWPGFPALQRHLEAGQRGHLLGVAHSLDEPRCRDPVPGNNRLLPGDDRPPPRIRGSPTIRFTPPRSKRYPSASSR